MEMPTFNKAGCPEGGKHIFVSEVGKATLPEKKQNKTCIKCGKPKYVNK